MDSLIALLVDSPIYAPLFVADEAGLLPDTTQIGVLGSEAAQKSMREGSAEMLRQVFSSAGPEPLVAVCDPMHASVFNQGAKGGETLGVLAGFITKPVFWLFDSNLEILGDLRELIAQPAGVHTILTHPRPMTVDTITRLLLQYYGLRDEVIEEVVRPVDSPGREVLQYLGLTADSEAGKGVVAASVDLLELMVIEDANRGHCFCYGKPIIPDGIDYLMTAVVCSSRAWTSPANQAAIQHVLGAIEIATGLWETDKRSFFALLKRHYERRATRQDNEAVYGYKNMVPLPVLQEQYITVLGKNPQRFADMMGMLRYPKALPVGAALRRAMEVTKVGFSSVQKGHNWQLPPLYDQPLFESTKTTILVGRLTSTLQPTLPLRSAHAGAVKRWVMSQPDNVLDLRKYKVDDRVPFYRFDSHRAALQERVSSVLGSIQRWIVQKPDDGTVFSALICGTAGTGKTQLASAIIRHLNEHGVGASFGQDGEPTSINVAGTRNSELADKITQQLLSGREAAKSSEFTALLVDEIDKRFLPGGQETTQFAWSQIFPYLLYKASERFVELPSNQRILKSRILWFFAGAFPSAQAAEAKLLREGDGGKDFISRMSPNDRIDIPPIVDVAAKTAACLAPVLQLHRRMNVDSETLSIQAEALFLTALLPFEEPRQRSYVLMEGVRAAHGANRSTIATPDLFPNDSQRRRMQEPYYSDLAELAGRVISITG